MKTQRNTIFILLLLFTFNTLNAQVFRAGIKGGINLAKHTEELQHTDFKYRTGFIGGGFISYGLTELVSFQSEILYSMKGNTRVIPEQILGQVTIPESKVFTKLNYIEIPLLLIIAFDLNSNFRPKILFGPVISFLLTAKSEAESYSGGGGIEVDQKDLWKSSDYGIIFGVGGDYNIGNNKIVLDIRYNLGLADLNNGVGGGKITSNTISFMLGYAIGF